EGHRSARAGGIEHAIDDAVQCSIATDRRDDVDLLDEPGNAVLESNASLHGHEDRRIAASDNGRVGHPVELLAPSYAGSGIEHDTDAHLVLTWRDGIGGAPAHRPNVSLHRASYNPSGHPDRRCVGLRHELEDKRPCTCTEPPTSLAMPALRIT